MASIAECLERMEDSKMAGMSAVELPLEPKAATQLDLEHLKQLRQKHEQELEEFEEETRRQRHQLRKLKRTLGDNKPPAAGPEQGMQRSKERESLEAEEKAAAAAREVAAAEQFALERTRLEEELANRRARRKEEEMRMLKESLSRESCTNDAADDHSDRESEVSQCERGRPPCATVVSSDVGGVITTVSQVLSRAGSESHCFFPPEEGLSTTASAVPSCSASVVSSAAASRCTSPTGSDAASRCQPAPSVAPQVEAVAVAAEITASPPAGSTPQALKKGSGKGKGKGKGGPMPPPPVGGTPRLSFLAEKPKPSKFVNLYWKVTQKPEVIDPRTFENDPFLKRLKELAPTDASTAELPSKIDVPALPETIFSYGVFVQPFPEQMLEAYFKRSEAAFKLPQGESGKPNSGSDARTNFIGDQKRLNMIGIMMQKHIMRYKEDSNREAILNIKRGVLQCDFDIVKLESLSVIRTVLRQHVKDGSPLRDYAQTHGEAAIWDLAYPEHHYLVYELSKVPQIDERLECMLLKLGFCENMDVCRQNLETLQKALDVLSAKRDLIRRFFVTAHRLGQSLSQRTSRGFQLSTLEKLTQTKSTTMQHLNILHFVLALMSRADAKELFTDEDIAALGGAKALGTAKVRDDCLELAQGLYGVKQIMESGEYTSQSTGQAVKIEKRRKTMPSRPVALSDDGQDCDIDTDDCFHEVMQNFVDSHVENADDIVVECHKMLLMYKELALFFDDLNSVYPPPMESTDKKLDLVDVFYRFAKVVPEHRNQVDKEQLRDKIGKEPETGASEHRARSTTC